MLRFNNAKFEGTSLVCRLRPRGPGAPVIAATDYLTPPPPDALGQTSGDERGAAVDGAAETQEPAPTPDIGRTPPTGPSRARAPQANAKFRYFILKSLTVEDLELSQKNGVWATQNHNEAALNQAFEVG